MMDWLVVHRLASRTVTVWSPGVWPANVWGEANVANPPPSMSICRVPVPPEKVAAIVPSLPLLHEASVSVSESETAGGWLRLTDWLVEHRLPSRS